MIEYFIQLPWFVKVLIIIIIIYVTFTIYDSEIVQINIIQRKLKKYFKILFEHGFGIYQIRYSSKYFGNCSAELHLNKYAVIIEDDRGYIQVLFIPNFEFRKDSFKLEYLIDYLKNENSAKKPKMKKESIKRQLEYFGSLINSHYEEIISFFTDTHFFEEERKCRAKYSIYG